MPLSFVQAAFEQRFQHQPLVVRAPGRVNLIGEHTDYNGGFVLPAAINREIYFAVGLNNTSRIRLYSYDQQEAYETENTAIQPSNTHWANYLLGVVAQFEKRGITVPGFDCV